MPTLPDQPISGLFATTTPIQYRGDSEHATGFFFLHNDVPYLITNRHVVDFETANGEPLSSIRILSRPNPDDFRETEFHDLDLRDDEGSPLWQGHPEDSTIDLVAICLKPPVVEDQIQIQPIRGSEDGYESSSLAFTERHLPVRGDEGIHEVIAGGTTSILLGYPYRNERPYFPVARNAVISSPYGQPFEGKPRFMTDARTHPGLSGCPVLSSPLGKIWNTSMTDLSSIQAAIEGEGWRLIGIHSERLGLDITTPLDLNAAWYSTLIMDIVSGD